jgi:hypothetical protein
MTNHEARLDRLALVYRRSDPVPTHPRWDYSALSLQEQYDLDQILARCRPPDPLDPHRRPDMSALSNQEVDRLADLMDRVVDRLPEPAAQATRR